MDHEVVPIGVGGKSGARPVAIHHVKCLAVLETAPHPAIPAGPMNRTGTARELCR